MLVTYVYERINKIIVMEPLLYYEYLDVIVQNGIWARYIPHRRTTKNAY